MPVLTLYDFGYQQPRSERMFNELIAIGCPLVDIRIRPTSPNPRYTQAAIQNKPGILYIHIPELGNAARFEDLAPGEAPIRIAALEAGLDILFKIIYKHNKAAIFCACANRTTCHCRTVSLAAKERLVILKIVHL